MLYYIDKCQIKEFTATTTDRNVENKQVSFRFDVKMACGRAKQTHLMYVNLSLTR